MRKRGRSTWLPARLLGGRFRDAEIVRHSLPYHVQRTIAQPVTTVISGLLFTVVAVIVVSYLLNPDGFLLFVEEGTAPADALGLLPNPLLLAPVIVLSFVAGIVFRITNGVQRDVRHRRYRRD